MTRKRFMPRAAILAAALPRPEAVIGTVRAEAGLDPETLLKQVKAELERIGGEVKRTAEEALREAKSSGGLATETKAKADELLVQQKALSAAAEKLTDKIEALETKNLDLEQRLAGAGRRSGDPPRSMGQQVTESEAFQAWAQAGAKGKIRIPVKSQITSANPGGGGLIWSDRETEIVRLPRRRMTIRALLDQGTTSSNLVEYARQSLRDFRAAPVAETAEKPESFYEWEQADAPVRLIAHWVHVSRQAADDAAQLQGEIDSELRYGLDFVEEQQLLKGDGLGQNLAGLVPNATAFAPAFTPTAETRIDTLRLALLQASLAEFPADGIVLHPTDWAHIELTKDQEHRYIFANVVQMAGPQLWGRPVIDTQSMDEDEFLVGAFMMAAKIYDRMEVEVLISDEDRDNFIKNMLTVRAEKRLALAVKRPAALITGSFDGAS